MALDFSKTGTVELMCDSETTIFPPWGPSGYGWYCLEDGRLKFDLTDTDVEDLD